jgi:hypothetical protein
MNSHQKRHLAGLLFVVVASIRFLLRQSLLGYPFTHGTAFQAWITLLALWTASHVLRIYSLRPLSLLVEALVLTWSLTNSFLLLLPLQSAWFLLFARRIRTLRRPTLQRQIKGTQPGLVSSPSHLSLGLLCIMLIQCFLALWILMGGQVPSGQLEHRSLMSSSVDAAQTQIRIDKSLRRWFANETAGSLAYLQQNATRPIWIWLQSDIGCDQSLAHARARRLGSRSTLHTCLVDVDPIPTLWRAYQSLVTASAQAGQETLFHSGSRTWAVPLPSSLQMQPLPLLGESPQAWIGVLPWATDVWYASIHALENATSSEPPPWLPPRTSLWLVSASAAAPEKAFLYCNTGPDPLQRQHPCQTQAMLPWTVYSYTPNYPTLSRYKDYLAMFSHADLGSLVRLLLYQPPHPLQDATLFWELPGGLIVDLMRLAPPLPSSAYVDAQKRWYTWGMFVAPVLQRRDLLNQWYREYDVTRLWRLEMDTRDPEAFFRDDGPGAWPWSWFHLNDMQHFLRDWIKPLIAQQRLFYRRLVFWTTTRNALLLAEASWLFCLWWIVPLFHHTPTSLAQLSMHLVGQLFYLALTNVLVRLWYAGVANLAQWDANVFLMRSHDVVHMVTALATLLIVPFSMGALTVWIMDACRAQWTVRYVKEWYLNRLTVTWFLWVTVGLLPQIGVQSLFPWIWNTPAGGSLWWPLAFGLQGVLQSLLLVGHLVGSMGYGKHILYS